VNRMGALGIFVRSDDSKGLAREQSPFSPYQGLSKGRRRSAVLADVSLKSQAKRLVRPHVGQCKAYHVPGGTALPVRRNMSVSFFVFSLEASVDTLARLRIRDCGRSHVH